MMNLISPEIDSMDYVFIADCGKLP